MLNELLSRRWAAVLLVVALILAGCESRPAPKPSASQSGGAQSWPDPCKVLTLTEAESILSLDLHGRSKDHIAVGDADQLLSRTCRYVVDPDVELQVGVENSAFPKDTNPRALWLGSDAGFGFPADAPERDVWQIKEIDAAASLAMIPDDYSLLVATIVEGDYALRLVLRLPESDLSNLDRIVEMAKIAASRM